MIALLYANWQEGRDALTLEEFCRWFPSVLGLEPLSPQHIQEILRGKKDQTYQTG